MAQRSMDNGRDDGRGTQRPSQDEGPSGRGADVAPPGSRERSEGRLSGWTPEREAESMQLRQGPFHRAAIERLYNPRGGPDVGDVGPNYDRDQARRWTREDADDYWRHSVYGRGRHEEAEARAESRSAEYRSRRGGAPESPRRPAREGRWREPEERPYYEDQDRYDAALGLDYASPGEPGMGVGPGGLLGEGIETRGRTHIGQRGTPRRRWHREPLTARELMTRGVRTVRRDSPLREVAQVMRDEDCGVVPVVDERGVLMGLVTDRDLALRAFATSRSPDVLRASEVMSEDLQAVTVEEDVHSIIDLMGRRQVRRVPVVDHNDRLLGIISLGDIANRADQDEELQRALERVSARRSFWNRLG
ncbi:CBS domain-containing protein [Myxococcaceae bacterium GXIMD 01537]